MNTKYYVVYKSESMLQCILHMNKLLNFIKVNIVYFPIVYIETIISNISYRDSSRSYYFVTKITTKVIWYVVVLSVA